MIQDNILITTLNKLLLKNEHIEKIFGSFLIKLLGVLFSFLLNIILVRIMGLEEYGRYYYIISIINFFSILATFGLDNTGVKHLTKYYIKKDSIKFHVFYSQSKNFVLRISLSIAFAIIISSYFLFWDDINNFLIILMGALLIPLKSLINIYFSALRALEKLYVYLCVSLFVKPVTIIFLVLILDRIINYKIDISTYFLINISIYLLIIYFIKNYIERIFPKNKKSKKNFKTSLFHLSFYIFSIQSFQLFNLSIDNIIINYYISLSSVSLFSVATNIASLVGFGLSSINIFLAPSISSLFHNNKTKDLQSILKLVAKLNLIFGAISTLAIIVFGKNFLELYNYKMIASYPLILILIIGQLFHVCCGSVTYLMIMTKLEKVAFFIIGGSALLNVIFNIILIPGYGLIGCAIATTVSVIFYNYVAAIIIIRRLKLNPTVLTVFSK